MSNMLEQAIADAAALREQAIKNAEQSVIEKYSHQIKEAVDAMLENQNLEAANSMISEAEGEMAAASAPMPASFGGGQEGATIEAPPAWDSRYDDIGVRFSALVDSLPLTEDGMVDLDLGEFEMSPEEKEAMGGSDDADAGLGDTPENASADDDALAAEPEGDDSGGGDESLDDLLATLQENKEINEEDQQLQEILDMLEEELHMEDGKEPWTHGGQVGGSAVDPIKRKRAADAREAYEQNMLEEDEEESSSEEDTDADEKQAQLYETIEVLSNQNDKLVGVLEKLETHLDEALLSNAKLLYQNRTLGDASLNERQKSKIVEAIANAESTKEAKQLFETLKATVGSTPNSKKGPQSLSESVNRKSNLSAMLNSRQNINESKQSADPFLEKMQKLAGIKK